MRKPSIALFGALLIVTPAYAAVTSGLVAYYDFQESTAAGLENKADNVGSDYAGPYVNATIVGSTPTTGFSGNAAFNSNAGAATSNRSTLLVGNSSNFSHNSTDAITTTIGSAALGSNYSISAWFYAAIDPDQAASQRYFVFEDGTNTTQFDISYGSQSANANATSLAMWGYNNGTTNATVQSASVSVGAWHHVVHTFSFDGANTLLTVYLDGATVGTLSVAGQPSFTELNFGNARDGQSRGWDGMIDEVAIYNRAIDSSEVGDLRNLGLSGQAIPEPSIALLGGLGVLALLRRRR